MMRANLRHLLGLGAVLAISLAMIASAVLGQWTWFAIAGTVLVASIGALSLWALASLRAEGRRSTAVEKRAARLEQSLARLTDRQQAIHAVVTDDLAPAVTEVRSDLHRVETTNTAVLERVSQAERRLVGILESLRLEVDRLTVTDEVAHHPADASTDQATPGASAVPGAGQQTTS